MKDLLWKIVRQVGIGFILFGSIASGCKKESLYVKRTRPEVTIKAGDARLGATAIHFMKDTVYVLATNLVRNSGQELVIDAGTVVKIKDGYTIIINVGATIRANGTSSSPVIFTSAAEKGGAGAVTGGNNNSDHFWNGIRIYGTIAGASSGNLSYVRIEFAGGTENGFPVSGLLVQNVNKETKLDNIQVSYSYASPSFEFSGGDCNAYNLVSYASAGTDFYLHDGYTGMMQNLLAYRHPYFPAGNNVTGVPLAGVLLEGAGTFPLISNLTVAGPDPQNSTSIQYSFTSSPRASLVVNSGSKFLIRNAVLFGFPLGAFYMNDRASGSSLQFGESSFTYSIVQSADTSRVFYLPPTIYPPFTSADFKNFMMDPAFVNGIFVQPSQFLLTDLYSYDTGPNPMPGTGSPILTGANFDGPFSNPFFKKVTYKGALGTDNWLNGWVNFTPLQTSYN